MIASPSAPPEAKGTASKPPAGSAIFRTRNRPWDRFRKGDRVVTLTPQAVGLAAGVALIWLLTGLSALFLWVALGANLLLLLLIGFDLRETAGEDAVSLERQHDPRLSLGAENGVTLRIDSRSSAAMKLQVRDRPPVEWIPNPAVHAFLLKPGETKTVEYTLTPTERGEYRFGDVWLRRDGRLGLIVRQWRSPLARTVKVYPNVKETRKYETLLIKRRLNELGIRSARNLGAGRVFSSLRDYTPDDEFRSIDWSATARRVKLIARQYEVERSQQVMAILDCGRMMVAPVSGNSAVYSQREEGKEPAGEAIQMTKLDFAVNAALVYCYVSLELGDRAGMMTFAEGPGIFIPPYGGKDQLERLLEQLYAVRASPMDSSYAEAYLQLQSRLRKRSLLLFFTDLMDPETAGSAVRYLGLLARRHLCICVALGDPEVTDWATRVPVSDAEVYQQAVAITTLQDRQRALKSLQQHGVQVVDALPNTLTAETVNRYLQMKLMGRL